METWISRGMLSSRRRCPWHKRIGHRQTSIFIIHKESHHHITCLIGFPIGLAHPVQDNFWIRIWRLPKFPIEQVDPWTCGFMDGGRLLLGTCPYKFCPKPVSDIKNSRRLPCEELPLAIDVRE
ncbi:hypothetical protein DCAR_0726950 [Daucus carota subsp. sativus]|uniref:Uncharacterized protein n=1 Tax=Daucus carota subsp. sativus TaxID=79200 RepID=A0A161WPX0_DAUCS|nr:hypothetical protein DCAR_0726950 [Daucus carota subsp. sativus]